MNEAYEQEIDLKWLFYRVLRAWRPIVGWAIVIALVVGLGSFARNLLRKENPEFVETQKLNFEREHDSWVATGNNLQAQMENLIVSKSRQAEYNEKSVLMQIDPLREFTASFELYVDYDYQIMPDMAYQNIDLSNRIMRAYETYMTNGELYQYLIDKVSFDIELRYLKEILSFSVDYNTKMISVSVRQQSAEYCSEVLNLVEEGLFSRHESIVASIADHKLTTTNTASYEAVNLALEDVQKANRQAFSELDIAMQKVNEEYAEWKKEPEPEYDYSNRSIVKSAIKLMIIGGLAGGVLIAAIVAFVAMMSGKLLNPEDIKRRYGVRVIGELPTARVKKPFAFVSRWFAALGGVTVKPEDYDRLAQRIGSGLKSELGSDEEKQDWKKIVFVGSVSGDEMERVLPGLGMDSSYTLIAAPDVLTDAVAVERVTAADCVVLIEKQECTVLADITKELEALKAWNKPVIGAIITNVDAVM